MTDTHRIARAAIASIAAISLPLLAACGGPSGRAELAGRAVVVVSDGDMSGTTLADGVLFPGGAKRERDALSVIRLPLDQESEEVGFGQCDLSNSALGPPRLLAVRPQGDLALVLSTRGRAIGAAGTLDALPREGALHLVSITGYDPMVLDSLDLGYGVTSVSVHPSGDLAAAVRNSPQGPFIDIVEIMDGQTLGLMGSFPLLGVSAGPDVLAATAAFSPSGDALAVSVLGADVVALYRFVRTDTALTLTQWGGAVGVGPYPYTIAWTPDAKGIVVSELWWGSPSNPNRLDAPSGTVSVIAVSPDPGADASHQYLGFTTVGMSPEGLAVSPDGSLAVTGNIRRSFLHEDDARFTRGGSLSLVSIDPATGRPSTLGEWPCAAGPQGLAFDASGRYVLVTDFEDGVVQVWEVRGRTLKFTGVRIGVGRGAHAVAVVP